MDEKLNILFIASWYPTKYTPFDGDFIQRHARAVALYCNVTVIHLASVKQKEDLIIEDIRNSGVWEIRVFHKKLKSKFGIIRAFKNLFFKLRAFKKAFAMIEKTDIVHLNVLFPAGVFALYLKFRYKIPFIVTEHWSKFLPDSNINFTSIEFFLIKQIVNNAKLICPVSGNLKRAMISMNLHGNYQIVPNVVDTNVFFPVKEIKKPDIFNIVHISGMTDRIKNITGMLNAVKKAYFLSPNFKITFVGTNNYEDYEQYVHKIGIPKDIINFIGVVSYSDVAQIMRQHHILLMFSNYENAPCVISEALVSGLPVISSAVGGIPEMIDDTNGYLVEKQNENQLALKIIEMIGNYNKFNTEFIAKNAKQKYSYQVVGKKYFD
ncbi:MAG: glycosyltransferase family 4 protein, partial [Bacteroidales bacterium]|nr:glycosyltransferase family 4 protein [Bacteroidales bacterium]